MAKFTRSEVTSRMQSQGLVPLFFNNDIKTCRKTLRACYEGGARLLEFTNRGDFAHEIFSELVKYVRSDLPEMIIGTGSIMDAETTAIFLQAGADFIVSPILNEKMAQICHRRGVMWSPGCGTLTEISRANAMGAEIVKVFPGSHMGPGFIKAVLGPCPWLKLMPTGGVAPGNLHEWFDAGATCVGMGSKLVKKEFVAEGRFDELCDHVSDTLNQVSSLRSNS